MPEANALLAKLDKLKVVDPACGSGAYLLGMLHELHALNNLLYTRAKQATAHDDYQQKLRIIERTYMVWTKTILPCRLQDFAYGYR